MKANQRQDVGAGRGMCPCTCSCLVLSQLGLAYAAQVSISRTDFVIGPSNTAICIRAWRVCKHLLIPFAKPLGLCPGQHQSHWTCSDDCNLAVCCAISCAQCALLPLQPPVSKHALQLFLTHATAKHTGSVPHGCLRSLYKQLVCHWVHIYLISTCHTTHSVQRTLPCSRLKLRQFNSSGEAAPNPARTSTTYAW
jgi:hypothetical protein